ncbi:hypothetical protein [Streptomyces sp. NPDC059371]|uniref:hypothetical protein n=1 Tax=Streptomyces sp. NPDC059371 TaxID=3346812 RepID=UPI0036B7B1E4
MFALTDCGRDAFDQSYDKLAEDALRWIAERGVEAQVAYIGERGARIVLVGEDGGWGDLVATSYEIAEKAVEKAGVTVHEAFDGEFAAKVKTGPYEWKRMAGIQLGGRADG